MPTAGPVGRQFIDNLRELLEARGLSHRRASAALEALGRPIPPLGISRTLDADRRIDVDELVAWAALLGVDPVTLLLPHHIGPDDVVELTPKMQQRARIVWGWMRGRWPLPPQLWPDGAALSFRQTEFAEFAERTRPDFEQPLADPAVAELVELQQLIELVLGSDDPVARWTRTRDTLLRRFRLAALQMEELAARLDLEALAAGAFTFDAEAAQREIRTATGWVRGPASAVSWTGPEPADAGTVSTSRIVGPTAAAVIRAEARGEARVVPGPHDNAGAATTVPPPGPHGAATSRVVDPLDPFGKRDP